MSEMNEQEIQKRLELIGQLEPSVEAAERDLEKVRRVLAVQKARRVTVWQVVVKSRTVRFSAAAGVMIAVLLGVWEFGSGSGVAWAEVIEPILNARTAVMDLVIGPEGNEIRVHDEILGTRIRRTMSNMPDAEMIIDLKEMRSLTLEHNRKSAVYLDLEGLGSMQDYLQFLREIISRIQERKDIWVEDRGLGECAGHECVIFITMIDEDVLRIWADPQTKQPVRIEQQSPNAEIVCYNLQFDVALDEGRFSMEVPQWYELHRPGGIDFGGASESDFIESLRVWAEIIEEGRFPDFIGFDENVVKMAMKLEGAFRRAAVPAEEQMDLAMRWAQGLVFLRFFDEGRTWHYAGKGVELGDGERAIFWYQPKDSSTWRVIYGDLRVEDVSAEDLPGQEGTPESP